MHSYDMNGLSNEEYLELITRLTKEQYDDAEPMAQPDPFERGLRQLERAVKAKLKIPANSQYKIDASDFKLDQIKPILTQTDKIQVNNFTVDVISRPLSDKGEYQLNILIWEKRFKTPSGNPCNIDYRILVNKDKRFATRKWAEFFKGSYSGVVSVDTVVDIIRWMQMLKRLPAFL